MDSYGVRAFVSEQSDRSPRPHERAPPKSLLRIGAEHDSGKVGMVELFFDWCSCSASPSSRTRWMATSRRRGGARGPAVARHVVVWINTSWVTNWLDPERIPCASPCGVDARGPVDVGVDPEAFDSRD